MSVGKIGREAVMLGHAAIEGGLRVISLRKATEKGRSEWLAAHP